MAANASEFVGWFRALRTTRWVEHCRAPSEAACWDKLLDLRESGDKLVLGANRGDPNERAR